MPHIDPLDAIRSLIRMIGDDPDREGLLDTPQRVLTAWEADWGRGYTESADTPAKLLTTFEGSGRFSKEAKAVSAHPQFNEMIVVKDIIVYSMCEHHLAPFFGVAHIAYIPNGRGIVGLSKLARLTDHFARRLQVQERLTVQIADAIAAHLSIDVGVMIECRHMCMMSRGVMQPNSTTITTALRGEFYSEPTVRAEFLGGLKKA